MSTNDPVTDTTEPPSANAANSSPTDVSRADSGQIADTAAATPTATAPATAAPDEFAAPSGHDLATKVRFMAGFLAWSVCNAIAFYMVVSIMMPQRLKDIGVENPNAVLGTINAAGAILSIFYAVFIGAFSDRTRSRFGRRTPWIVVGAVLYAAAFWLVSVPDSGLAIGAAYCIGLIGLNAVQAPVLTIVSDRIPASYRATASAAIGGGGVAGQAVGMLIGSFFITRMTAGFVVAAVFALGAGWLSMALMPKEPSAAELPREQESAGAVIIHAMTPPTKNAGDFWKAFLCRTCLIVAYQMITSYQLYILQDHVGLSVTASAAAISVMSIITMIVSFIASFVSGPISDRIGRRKPPILFACLLYGIGIAMPWIFPTEMGMFLFAGIAGFGYGMYMAVDQALNVDVLPNKKDAGKDLGILNIATCAGQAFGSFVTSMLVTATGGYDLVFPVAIVIAVLAGVAVLTIRRIR